MTSQYDKFNRPTGLMSGKIRFSLRSSPVKPMRGTIGRTGNVFHVPGVLTVIVYLLVPLAVGSAVSDVGQALLYHLGEWIASGQHTFAANDGVAEQGYRVTDPARGIVQVSQVGQARERVGMVGAEHSL
jgi:hypothetical protein